MNESICAKNLNAIEDEKEFEKTIYEWKL